MTEPASSHVVVLAGPELPEVAALGPALAEFFKMPLYEAARLGRDSWGILDRALDEAGAKALAARLKREGVAAAALGRGAVAGLPPAAALRAMEFSRDGAILYPKEGGPARLPWAGLTLVAAAAYKETTTKTVKVVEVPNAAQKAASMGLLMMGLPIRIGPKKQEVSKTLQSVELSLLLDLVARDPWRRFRVSYEDFDYACLGERMQPGTTENFRALVELLASLAPRAVQNRGSRALIGRQPTTSMGYESATDLERESRWLLTVASLL